LSNAAVRRIGASHLIPDSVIKIGFRHSRHISAYQYAFLHMIAPYLDMDSIRQLTRIRSRQERENIFQQAKIPSFRDLRDSINSLQAVG